MKGKDWEGGYKQAPILCFIVHYVQIQFAYVREGSNCLVLIFDRI